MTYPRVHVDTVVVVYIGFELNVKSSTGYQELELKICIEKLVFMQGPQSYFVRLLS